MQKELGRGKNLEKKNQVSLLKESPFLRLEKKPTTGRKGESYPQKKSMKKNFRESSKKETPATIREESVRRAFLGGARWKNRSIKRGEAGKKEGGNRPEARKKKSPG